MFFHYDSKLEKWEDIDYMSDDKPEESVKRWKPKKLYIVKVFSGIKKNVKNMKDETGSFFKK